MLLYCTLVEKKWRGREPKELSTLQTLAIYQQNMVDIFVFVKSLGKLLVQVRLRYQGQYMLGMTKKKKQLNEACMYIQFNSITICKTN